VERVPSRIPIANIAAKLLGSLPIHKNN